MLNDCWKPVQEQLGLSEQDIQGMLDFWQGRQDELDYATQAELAEKAYWAEQDAYEAEEIDMINSFANLCPNEDEVEVDDYEEVVRKLQESIEECR